jgi:hypothetical protein
MWYSAWIVNYEVNFAWVPIVLIWLFVYALSVTLVVGLPFLLLRRSRRATRTPAKMDIADELKMARTYWSRTGPRRGTGDPEITLATRLIEGDGTKPRLAVRGIIGDLNRVRVESL